MTTDFSAIARAYGFSGDADVLQGFKEMVTYLNKHGGLGGHMVKPDWYYLDGASANGTTAYQAACTHFVQDAHVQLVVTDGNFDPTFETCLAQDNIPHVDVNKYGLDATGQRQYPNYLAPVSFGVDRYTTALVETAVATRMIAEGQRIGVVIEGCAPNIRTYEQVWGPLAKQHGLQVESVQTLCNNGTADLGNETAQIQSAVLKFRADGVTSVSFVSVSEGFIAVLFAQNAEQQGWHPQYLMSSVSMPERGVESQGNGLNFPPGQLPQIRGVGWAPTTDVGSNARPTPGQRAQRKTCHNMSPSQAGAANAPDPGVQLDFIEHYLMECDTMLLLRQALEVNEGRLTLGALRTGLAQALSSFVSVSNLTGSLRFPTGRADGQDAVAPLSYTVQCKCIRYTGATRRVT
jgi:hypothetical protein